MFTSPVLLLLVAAAVILAVVWRRTEDKRYGIGVGVVALLILLFFGYHLVRKKTPGELIQMKLEAMAAAVKAKDVDGIFRHVSTEFRSDAGDKTALQNRAKNVLDSGELTDVQVWKFQPAQVNPAKDGQKGTATIEFRMTLKGQDIPAGVLFRVIAHFVEDPDGEWRLANFELFRLPGNERFTPR